MHKNKKIFAMIPARLGSQRLPRKNAALIAGKPLISYAIEAAKACPYFDEIIVNTNDQGVAQFAQNSGVKTFDRSEKNANSEARSDEVVEEFLKQFPCDVVVWVNTTSPLQPHGEITKAIDYFFEKDLDTLFTVFEEKVHCNFKQEKINYNPDELFAKTQDLEPVQRFVYSVMMWKSTVFLKTLKEKGSGFFAGKVGTFPVSKLTSILIKNQEDLMIADFMAQGLQKQGNYEVKYYN